MSVFDIRSQRMIMYLFQILLIGRIEGQFSPLPLFLHPENNMFKCIQSDMHSSIQATDGWYDVCLYDVTCLLNNACNSEPDRMQPMSLKGRS